jgi:tetratricopeptide (TPR) repeat protein
VETLYTAAILLVVSYRPEYEDRWGTKGYYRRLQIDALPRDSAGELAQALLGGHQSLEGLRSLLVQRTEGNPLFLEESVRALAGTGTLVGRPGAYSLASPVTHIDVPASVRGVLAARIDRLAPAEKQLLQSASVIGREIPFGLLRYIANLPKEVLEGCISKLLADEFLYETALFGQSDYIFKHALTHEVAYGSLLLEQRRILHARIVEAIEKLYWDRLAEHVDRLASHARQGGLWSKAVAYLREAGRKAAGRSASKESVAYFEQALASLARLPEDRSSLEHALDLRFDLRNALLPLGELARILSLLDEAGRIARKLDDSRRLAWVSIYMSAHVWQVGRAADACAFAEEAETIAEQRADFSLRVAATFYVGQTHFVLGDYHRAESALRSSLRLLEGQTSKELSGLAGLPFVMAGSYLAWALAERGEFDEAILRGEEAVRLAEAADHRYSQILAWWRLACAFSLRGDFRHAVTLLERGVANARESSVTLLMPYAMWPLGHAYAHTGRSAEGLAMLSESLERLQALGSVAFDSLARTRFSEACLLAGRVEDATAHAEQSLMAARERGERGHEAWALRAIGDVASHRGPAAIEEAETRYRQALKAAQELGMRPLLAHCHFGLAKLARPAGKWDDAREHLTTAATMYREMGMTYWLEKAEAAATSE